MVFEFEEKRNLRLAVKSWWCYSEMMINGVKHSNGHKIEGVIRSNEPTIPGSTIEASSVKFDLEAVLSAVRPLRSVVPADAHSEQLWGQNVREMRY